MNYESTDRSTQRYQSDLQRLLDDMRQLKRDVYGDPQYGTEGLLHIQRRIHNRVEMLFRILIGIVIIEGVILAIVMVLLWQQWL